MWIRTKMADAQLPLALCLNSLQCWHAKLLSPPCVYGELSGFRMCGGEVQWRCSESSGTGLHQREDTRRPQSSDKAKTMFFLMRFVTQRAHSLFSLMHRSYTLWTMDPRLFTKFPDRSDFCVYMKRTQNKVTYFFNTYINIFPKNISMQ